MPYLRTADAARRTGFHRGTLTRFALDGQVRAVRTPEGWLFDADSLAALWPGDFLFKKCLTPPSSPSSSGAVASWRLPKWAPPGLRRRPPPSARTVSSAAGRKNLARYAGGGVPGEDSLTWPRRSERNPAAAGTRPASRGCRPGTGAA